MRESPQHIHSPWGHGNPIREYSKPRVSRIRVDPQIYPTYAKIRLMRSEIKGFGTTVTEILSEVCENPTYARFTVVHCWHIANMPELYVFRQLTAHIESKWVILHHTSFPSIAIYHILMLVTAEKCVIMVGYCICTDADELNRRCVSGKYVPTAKHALYARHTHLFVRSAKNSRTQFRTWFHW